MHNIYTFALGLVLVASQAVADGSSSRKGNDQAASPGAAASQAKGIENTSPSEGARLNTAVDQMIEGQNGGAPDDQSAAVITEPFKSDYLDGGHFGGRSE